MSRFDLGLTPRISQDQERVGLIRSTCEQVAQSTPLFEFVPDTPEPLQAFIASTPEIALRWICKRVDKKRLLRFVQHEYDTPVVEVLDTAEEGSSEESPEAHVVVPAKRKRVCKERSTRQANKQLRERLDTALVVTVANTQDWASARKKDVTMSEQEQRYKTFAQRFPGAGVEIVAGLINKAAAIGTVECLKDWRSILHAWRAEHRDGKRFLTGVSPQLPTLAEYEDSGSDTGINCYGIRPDNEALSTQMTCSSDNEPSLSYAETTEFKDLFLAARRSQAIGIVGDMRHRWIMAAMYTKYETLETLTRKRAAPSGGRGRGFATVAKEQLFSSVYSRDSRPNATREACAAEWKEFGRWLDYGRRWCMLKDKFGLGIFGLLPRSVISNSFIERGLTVTRFAQWVEMVATCNTNVREMAKAIAPLYDACITDQAPPARLLLEDMDEDQWKDCDPLIILSSVDSSQKSIVEE